MKMKTNNRPTHWHLRHFPYMWTV